MYLHTYHCLHSMIAQFRFRDAETVNQSRHREYQNAHLNALSSLLNILYANLDALLPTVMTMKVRLLLLFSTIQNQADRLYLGRPLRESLLGAYLNLAAIVRRTAQT